MPDNDDKRVELMTVEQLRERMTHSIKNVSQVLVEVAKIIGPWHYRPPFSDFGLSVNTEQFGVLYLSSSLKNDYSFAPLCNLAQENIQIKGIALKLLPGLIEEAISMTEVADDHEKSVAYKQVRGALEKWFNERKESSTSTTVNIH